MELPRITFEVDHDLHKEFMKYCESHGSIAGTMRRLVEAFVRQAKIKEFSLTLEERAVKEVL